MLKSISSLRLRATLLISSLLLAVVAVYAAAAYQQMSSAALDNVAQQMVGVPGPLSTMVGRVAVNVQAEVAAIASEPAIAAFLRSPDSATAAVARAALAPAEAGANAHLLELRDLAGRRVLAAGGDGGGIPAAADEDLRPLLADTLGGIGLLRGVGEMPLYPVAVPVIVDGARRGTLIRWERLRGAGFLTPGTTVYLANTRSDLWTDLREVVPALAVDPRSFAPAPPAGTGGAAGVEPRRVGPLLVVGTPVAGTPWTVMLGFAVDTALEGPRRVIGRMVIFGILLLLAAAAAAWALSGRLTGSIAELSSAARALSAGDYSRRTTVTGEDEVGVLGRAFNGMAENVEEASLRLREKIAEVEASEQQHRETRERMEHVITSSGVILYKYSFADREVRLEWVSDNVKRLLGYDPVAALSPGLWRRLLHPDDHDAYRAGRSRLEAQGSATLEYRLRHASGEYRWVRDEQRLLRDAAGNPREVVGVLLDVNEHHRLQGAREAAEAANLAKSEFLSRMSHELRTPLNSVLGFGQLLQLDLESEENRESAEQILKAGTHLLSLIDEVLDIARIEAGQMSLSVEPVWVASTIEECLGLVRITAAQHNITIRAGDALRCEHFVWADQQRLKQVILNLLSNAIKYNRREGRVTLTCEEEPEGRLRIVVEDDGFGIPASRMKLLFTPFERLGAEEAGVEGTGLGLSLSRGLMEAMGGSLRATSEEGKGSRFWIELPIAERPPLEEPLPEEVALAAIEAPGEGQLHTVLFVEDNLANVRLLERLFQRRPGIHLLTAMQGSLGLQLARERRPDLILLDLNLPDLPGDVVLRNIRQDPDLREIPVVMISGDAIPSQIQRLLDLGARAYITKPFDLQELLRTVDELLRNGSG